MSSAPSPYRSIAATPCGTCSSVTLEPAKALPHSAIATTSIR
jgi:hypothetical protein